MGIAVIAALFFLFLQYLRLPDVLEKGKVYFLDPDSYTWLSRAERVLEGPETFVHFHPEDDYPHGYASHWTQPFNWALALLAAAARPFSGPGREALEWAGLWICPLFGALAAALLAAWAFRRFAFGGALLASAVFLVNPFILWSFALGRPDHQCLLFLALLAAMLLLLEGPGVAPPRRGPLAASAVLCAAGIWVSVEALAVWALLLGGLVIEAALAPPARRMETVRTAIRWGYATAGAVFLFALVEREGRLLTWIPDSISTGQALLMGLATSGLLPTLRFVRRARPPGRYAWFALVVIPPVLLGAAAAAGLLLFTTGPVDPSVRTAVERWFANNLEFLPAVFFVNGKAVLGRLHAALAYTLYALPFLLLGLWKTPRLRGRAKWILGVGLTAGTFLTLWQMRWRDLHALLAAPVLACALPACLQAILPVERRGRRWAAGVAALSLAALVLLLLPWLRQDRDSFRPGRRPRRDYVALRIISEAIRASDPYHPPSPEALRRDPPPAEAVLAPWDTGPLVHYMSGRPVIAGPYHRNMEGILDTMRAYTARDPEAFAAIARRRGIRYLVRPPLGDPLYDTFTFETILESPDPLLRIRREEAVPGGWGTGREYAPARGKTWSMVKEVLRYRLEENRWDGWPGLAPVPVPGLEAILPDAKLFPYLYRYVGKGGKTGR